MTKNEPKPKPENEAGTKTTAEDKPVPPPSPKAAATPDPDPGQDPIRTTSGQALTHQQTQAVQELGGLFQEVAGFAPMRARTYYHRDFQRLLRTAVGVEG